jgi:hypothetical protein
MKKLMLIVGIALCGALLAVPALSEQGDTGAPQPAPAAPTKGPAGAKAVKAGQATKAGQAPLPVKADQAQAGQTTAGETAGETATGEESALGSMPADVAGFTKAMSEQITAVGGEPHCTDTNGRCYYQYRGEGERAHEIQLWYSELNRTIYVFVNHLAAAPQTGTTTPTVVRHIAAASRAMGRGRFEWNPTDGEVRLGAVLNVDTNFDPRALQSLLRFVQSQADRYAGQVAGLVQSTERAPALAQAGAGETPGAVTDPNGYMNAIEQELTALDLTPTCQTAQGRCTFELDSEEARNVFSVTVQYNSTNQTVLVTIDQYLTATTENPRTDRLLQRLMELNWQQLVPMFQWNAADGHVRLAGLLNTDSNFDRRAFRGVVQAVDAVAARNYRELRTLMNP